MLSPWRKREDGVEEAAPGRMSCSRRGAATAASRTQSSTPWAGSTPVKSSREPADSTSGDQSGPPPPWADQTRTVPSAVPSERQSPTSRWPGQREERVTLEARHVRRHRSEPLRERREDRGPTCAAVGANEIDVIFVAPEQEQIAALPPHGAEEPGGVGEGQDGGRSTGGAVGPPERGSGSGSGNEEAESVLRREQCERVLRERSEQLQRRNRRRNRIEAVTGRPAGREDGAPGNPLGEAGEIGLRGKGEAQHGTGTAPVRLPDFVPFSGFDDEDGLVVQSDGPRNSDRRARRYSTSTAAEPGSTRWRVRQSQLK